MPSPFVKGNKCAVGIGRPRKHPDLVAMCKMNSPKCVERLVEIVGDKKERTTDQLTAINLLLSFGFGKPKASLDLNASHDVTVQFLDALKEINARVVDDEPPLIETAAEGDAGGDLGEAIREANEHSHRRQQPNSAKHVAELVDAD